MSEKIKADEITKILQTQLENFDNTIAQETEMGTVLQIGDGIAQVHGLEKIMVGELVKFENGSLGMALNLEKQNVGVALLDNTNEILEGSIVKRTGRVAAINVGEKLLGRVINPLGEIIDGGPKVECEQERLIEIKAPGIIDRKGVHEPLQTGIKAIDTMIPIGKGQRELIIGDRQSGKTTIAIDTIINQKGKNIKCFYVSIGQKQSTLAAIVERLRRENALEYTTIICSSAAENASLQFIAPYVGVTMAEYFRDKGEHALIIYDDLSKHAQAYRQISLLLRRPPGREAYPGDIFYLHSRLLERAAKLSDKRGGGSLTALPIIETQAGDVSAYIPTNVISITDGQIFLNTELFNKGQKPAIDIGLSVSRVGGAAQTKVIKQAAGSLKGELAQYRELEAFSQFSSDLDETTRKQLIRGERLMQILRQNQYSPMSVTHQAIIVWVGSNGYLDDIPLSRISEFEEKYLQHLDKNNAQLLEIIEKEMKFTDECLKILKESVEKFLQNFSAE